MGAPDERLGQCHLRSRLGRICTHWLATWCLKLLQRSSDLGSGLEPEAGTINFLNLIIPDSPASGSFELRPRAWAESLLASLWTMDRLLRQSESITIDSLDLQRLDLLKIDIEGMEIEALAGAKDTIAR